MAYFAPPLINLAYVRTHRGLQSTETSWDAFLLQLIREASADFQAGLQRVCAPYTATEYAGVSDRYGRELRVDDLLAVTSVTNASGAAVDASVYHLTPRNSYPRLAIELTASSSAFWDFAYPDDAVTVVGTWGYVPNYGSHLRASGAVVPVGDLSSSATSMVLASGGAAFSPGDLVVIDSEWLLVTVVSSNTLTVERAQLGTTAAMHTAATPLYLYATLEDIRFAVRELVAYYWKTKDQIGARVSVFDGGVVQVQDIDPSVERIRKRHRRFQSVLGV